MSSTSAMAPNVKIHHQPATDEPNTVVVASSVEDEAASSAGVGTTPMSSLGGGSPPAIGMLSSPPTQTTQSVHNNSSTTQQRPVLYSAIGSLENCSVNNMGSFRTRILNAQQNGGTTANGRARDFPHSRYNNHNNTGGRNFPLLPPSKAAAPTPIIMANKNLHSPTTGVPLQLLTTTTKQQHHHHPITTGLVSALAAAEHAQRDCSLHHDNTTNNCGLQQDEKKSSTPSKHLKQKPLDDVAAADDPASKAASNQTKSNDSTESTTIRHNSSASDASVPSIAATEVSPEATALALVPTTTTTTTKTTLSSVLKKPSKLKTNKTTTTTSHKKKHVTIDAQPHQQQAQPPMEMFRPSCDAYTPRLNTSRDGSNKMKYKPAELRTPTTTTTMGTISRPNFRDALKRVAMILQQHICKIERRFDVVAATTTGDNKNDVKLQLFSPEMADMFCEEQFVTPRYTITMVRIPMADPGVIYGMRKIDTTIYNIPTADEIYDFAHQLFQVVQLSSECSIVCLIYVERLMEVAKVPLLAKTWKPIFMCGLLLASKVWQDLSSWNIEFASVYPQFSLDAINRLELQFLRMVKWDLYISSSLYAKYYFALRSLLEKKDFRQRYNRMVGGVDSVAASEALKVQQRTEVVKEEALLQLSRSM